MVSGIWGACLVEGAQCESREESIRGERISLCDQDDPYREVLHKLPRTTPFTSSVRLQGTVVDKKDLQFQKRKFCQLYMRYTRKIMAVTPFQCPDIEWMCRGTERGWFQRRPLEGRPSWCNWQRTVEELLKQAEEKYSPLQRAIEEVGPELGEFEGKRADVVHVGHSAWTEKAALWICWCLDCTHWENVLKLLVFSPGGVLKFWSSCVSRGERVRSRLTGNIALNVTRHSIH